MSTSLGPETTTFTADNLFAGSHPPISIAITLVTGQDLARGTVLGRITASGKYTAYASTNNDGSQTACAILAADCDATAGDEKTWAYVHGEFNANALTGSSAAAVLSLQSVGVFVKTNA